MRRFTFPYKWTIRGLNQAGEVKCVVCIEFLSLVFFLSFLFELLFIVFFWLSFFKIYYVFGKIIV